MANNCRMNGANVGRVQCPIIGYARDNTLVYHWAPYSSLHLDDASLSELQFYVVYDYVFVCHLLVTCVLYGPLMLYGVSNFPLYGLCICVWLCICMWLNVWTMCWTICGVLILRTYVFLCLFISYMLCFNVFHLCFQFYITKVCIICTNQWQQYVWFLLILPDF